jgi:crotonobetainyl-CoA:carnitine CoA-transferase CaiB-like acyl-CoA transferase
MGRPLAGITVIELAQVWAGPTAGMYLADQGAQVIKVEPLWGDDGRRALSRPPLANGQSRAFLALNRNKRGIALDISHPKGREVVYQLVRRADVLVHNFRPGVAERLGYDYPTLKGINPRLVYAWLTGYGPQGPYARLGSYDLIVQAIAGILGRRRLPDGTPVNPGVWVADMGAGILLAYAILLGLLHRERTGEGRMVTTSLLQAALAMQVVDLVDAEREALPERPIDYSTQAMYGCYRCADGQYLLLVVVQDGQWQRLCQALGMPHLAQDPRFATTLARAQSSPELQELLTSLLATRTREEWLALLQVADIPCAAVSGGYDVLGHPQIEANGMALTLEDPVGGKVRMVAPPVRVHDGESVDMRPAPLLGQHTREVLQELGYSQEQIAALAQEGIIGLGEA